MIGDESWLALQRALPHTLRVCSAFAVPDASGRGEAYREAMITAGDHGDGGPVLMAWARLAGLPGTAGAEMFADELTVSAPEVWVSHAVMLVDAGATGNAGQMAAALAAAITDLDDDGIWYLGWHLARIMSGVMDQAGGARAFNAIARRHWKAYPADELPGQAAITEPASLAVAAVAAGHAEYGRQVLACHYAREPGVIRALLNIWLSLAARLVRDGPAGSRLQLLRLDQHGLPDAFISTPASSHETIAEITRDTIAALAAGDSGQAARSLDRLAGLSPDELCAMGWILAYSLGTHFSQAGQHPGR